jgi:hypothetical protein
MHQARLLHQSTGKAARLFTWFQYQTRSSWSRPCRVVAKAEYLQKGEHPRFVVTSLCAHQRTEPDLYKKFYCASGARWRTASRMQMCLFADRLSTDEMVAVIRQRSCYRLATSMSGLLAASCAPSL